MLVLLIASAVIKISIYADIMTTRTTIGEYDKLSGLTKTEHGKDHPLRARKRETLSTTRE